ncbi:50S ribosomal protein L6 [Candidatus Uhrbacteria bacterium]|nr:50S ribosomal protein L6 [Candidatus Uhrbacteria bacterium]MBD3284395.1 50S ribosomal protein L6 [Candidatus Uhrbacteria bacterium]
MSRVGKKPIQIPNGVEVNVSGKTVNVKGPKGNLSVELHDHVTATVTPEQTVQVEVKDPDGIEDRALWGLFRKLVSNAVEGVEKGFEKKLEFVGVGYRVSVSGNKVQMEVGYSHPVNYDLPEGVKAEVEKNILTISGMDKQAVGEVAAQIRKVRPPEPYKGKGIKYVDEVIRRKAGKAAKAGA